MATQWLLMHMHEKVLKSLLERTGSARYEGHTMFAKPTMTPPWHFGVLHRAARCDAISTSPSAHTPDLHVSLSAVCPSPQIARTRSRDLRAKCDSISSESNNETQHPLHRYSSLTVQTNKVILAQIARQLAALPDSSVWRRSLPAAGYLL
eukprot:3029626-Rhodomonas_salina.3